MTFSLTYCTNIHAGETLDDVERALDTHVRAVRGRLGVERFGVGLRLSAVAVRALQEAPALERFRALLDDAGLYVETLNGFPYGVFHGQPVKEQVYRPDWREDERVAYTDALALVLAALLPEGGVGSVSTVPGAFRPRARTVDDVYEMALCLSRHVERLAALEAETGKRIVLALEPEPACFLETTGELVAFFESLALTAPCGEALVRRHVGVCLDACHAAVEFEEPTAAVQRLVAAGIQIAKVQVSAGLRTVVSGPHDDALRALAAFVEPTYLHQVVVRDAAGGLHRFVDLPQALAEAMAGEWRVHFHVPIFATALEGALSTTQSDLRALLRAARPHTRVFEVETYTWHVLPAALRNDDVTASIVRELAFARSVLETP